MKYTNFVYSFLFKFFEINYYLKITNDLLSIM